MKRMLSVGVGLVVLAGLAGGALAGMGPGMMGMNLGMMGMNPGMMGMNPGMMGMCPGMAGGAGTPITEEKAKALAQEYADTHLKGFTVDKVLPFGMHHGTAYSVELKGPDSEMRIFHVNPHGMVMPFGGPWRRGA